MKLSKKHINHIKEQYMTAIAQGKSKFLLSAQERSLLHKHRRKIHQTNNCSFSWNSLILSGLLYTILISSIIISGNTYQHKKTPYYSITVRPSLYMPETPPKEQKKKEIVKPAKEKPIIKKTTEIIEKQKSTAIADNNIQPNPVKKPQTVTQITPTKKPSTDTETTTPQISTSITTTPSIPINALIEQATLKSNYWAKVYSAITKEIKYPETAKIRGIEGYASINITINKNGELQKISNNSFSHKLFLRTVLAAVKRAAPYLPPPEKLKTPVTIDIPIRFKLI